MRWFKLACGLLVGVLLLACAPASRVILLPEASGRRTAVEVKTAVGAQLLSEPYQTASVSQTGALVLSTTEPSVVLARYGSLLGNRPADEQFLLYFESGGSQLTVDSLALLPSIVSRAQARSGGEIIVIGHTDRVGALEANDVLSLKRAQAIRELFIAHGFKPELVDAVGRGERSPLVPTEDEVDEPKNRRAEISYR